MSWGYWKPYVPVVERRAKAAKEVAKAKKSGQKMRPVLIEGRTIARTFWGKAWCDNLEAYSDYENRLPRGRTYVRNGSVIDLAIEPGKIKARVVGSAIYQIEIGIAAVPNAHWKSLAKECTGSIASLVELLQGKLSKAVMERICRPRSGLFPAPQDIRLDCSCPDWAIMCKHVAAVLYGVGARLDQQPELLFTLRQVDAGDLVPEATELRVTAKKAPPKGKVLDDALLADVFGIDIAAADPLPATKKKVAPRRTKRAAEAVIEPAILAKPVTKLNTVGAKTKKMAPPPPEKAPPPGVPKPPTKRKVAEPAITKKTARRARSTTPASRKRKLEPV
ncbi:MAG: SWIM zinc finger family protein [Betaproteobacteria bacterium]|nr:SWIM zinc finger family protein [Betaproteobacteria bacterium]